METNGQAFQVSISADVTISVQGRRYQLPRSAKYCGLPNPFLPLAGRRGAKITVFWPSRADYFVAVVDGYEYEIERLLAQTNAAGELKAVAETMGQQAVKELREFAASEFQRLSNMSKSIGNGAEDFDMKILRSQCVAMTLGAMFALAWLLGECEAPSVEIPRKAREIYG